ncbi:MAG: insulinase family protein [Oscillospiraceae bacterium]|nr:insulinase family protein [Oscillospiraceae bacterium]
MFDKVGECYKGFKVTRIRTSDEFQGRMVELIYEKTGTEVVWMDNGLANKLFSVIFKTLPENSTGVFHILEHSLLNGSKKFPVREPFVQLLKTSMNTFLNALTFPDMTIFPVSSRNTRDYLNLAEVYLDSVFAPLFLENPFIFYQEAWHIEEGEDGYAFNGVVYNEMKGSMSSLDRLVEQKVMEGMFPDHCYGYNSGGEPAVIPQLTYEDARNTYLKYYHPSNAKIFLDGDIPAEETFDLIESYLSQYEKREGSFDIPYQIPAFSETTISYELPKEEDPEDKEILSIGVLFGTWEERAKNLAVGVLKNVLFDSNESPIKRALLSSGLAKEMIVGVEDSFQQSYLQITVKNMLSGKADEVIKVIKEAAANELEKGIDRKALIASENLMEFRMLEPDEPQGLDHVLSATGSWIYGGDPIQYLEYKEDFAKVRAMIDSGEMEQLLKELIIDNDTWCVVHVIPSHTFGEEEREKEKERVKTITDLWTEEQIEENRILNERLNQWQNTPDTPEQLATVPVLTLDEVNIDPDFVSTDESEEDGVKVLFHEVACPGVVHFTMYFKLTDYEADDLFKIARACNLFGKLSTENYSALDLQQEAKLTVGRMDVSFDIGSRKDQRDRCTPFLTVTCSVLEDKLEDAQKLILEILQKTDFDQPEKIKEIFVQAYEVFKMMPVNGGHSLAIKNVMSGYSAAGALSDRISGYSAILEMKDLVESFDEKAPAFIEFMKSVQKTVFCKERLFTSISASHPVSLHTLLSALPEGEAVADNASFTADLPTAMGCPIPAKIGYSAQGKMFDEEFDGSMRVAANIISLGFLWDMVRVQGGAYGTGIVARKNGGITSYSYRDPQPVASVGVNKMIPEFLKQFCESDESIEGFIISTLSEDEPLRTPREQGAYGDRIWLSGYTFEELRNERLEILNTTKEKILSDLHYWEDFANEGAFSIVGIEDMLKDQDDIVICKLS